MTLIPGTETTITTTLVSDDKHDKIIIQTNGRARKNDYMKNTNNPKVSFTLSTHASITRPDNKVRELATVCLPWQQRTETSVWFDDIDISAFHICVVVDLWQSLCEWRLLLSVCVLVFCITTLRLLTWHCL
jgi:hypothetical protein